jgi:hypothetical protein
MQPPYKRQRSRRRLSYQYLALLYVCYKLEQDCAANEGLVRIQYKCLVPIYPYVFPGMKLCGLVISKTEL